MLQTGTLKKFRRRRVKNLTALLQPSTPTNPKLVWGEFKLLISLNSIKSTESSDIFSKLFIQLSPLDLFDNDGIQIDLLNSVCFIFLFLFSCQLTNRDGAADFIKGQTAGHLTRTIFQPTYSHFFRRDKMEYKRSSLFELTMLEIAWKWLNCSIILHRPLNSPPEKFKNHTPLPFSTT